MDECIEWRIERLTDWMNELMNEWMNERLNKWMIELMNGWMDESTDERTNEWIIINAKTNMIIIVVPYLS